MTTKIGPRREIALAVLLLRRLVAWLHRPFLYSPRLREQERAPWSAA
jgi:hypothetical protein